MATKKAKKVSKLTKAKAIVKKINNDLIDASFEAIETTVKTGEKWQKLTSKLIKKTEPLTKQQINMFVETSETIKGQVENATTRLKKLVGYDSTMIDQAKKMVTENPLAQKAEEMTAKLKKEVAKNPLVKKAEKMATKLKQEIAETIEEVKEKVEDFTEDVQDTVEKTVKGKKKAKKVPAKKKTVAKKPVVKKTTAKKVAPKKVVSKKATPKKVVVKKSTVKNDLKVIKGIGPKMENLLNKAGITSYEQISKITLKNLNQVLTDAGIVNLKMYNTSDWKVQAKSVK